MGDPPPCGRSIPWNSMSNQGKFQEFRCWIYLTEPATRILNTMREPRHKQGNSNTMFAKGKHSQKILQHIQEVAPLIYFVCPVRYGAPPPFLFSIPEYSLSPTHFQHFHNLDMSRGQVHRHVNDLITELRTTPAGAGAQQVLGGGG